jgi:hypothetical protein
LLSPLIVAQRTGTGRPEAIPEKLAYYIGKCSAKSGVFIEELSTHTVGAEARFLI